MKIADEITQNKNKLSIKTMYFNRFLLIRYATAAFFFVNINWFVFLMYNKSYLSIVPLALSLLILLPVAEQVKLYQAHKNELPLTKFYYQIQLGINLLLIPLTLTPIFNELFYFMNGNIQGKTLVISVLLLGAGLSVIIQRKLFKINHNQDKQYDRIKKYEKILGV